MRKQMRQRSLKDEITMKTPSCSGNPPQKNFRTRTKKSIKSKQTNRYSKRKEFLVDDMINHPSITSIKWHLNKENSRLRNTETNKSVDKDRNITRKVKKNIVQRLYEMKREKLISVKNFNRYEESPKNRENHNRSNSNKISRLRGITKDARLRTFNNFPTNVPGNKIRRVKETLNNKTLKEINFMKERSREKRNCLDLSIVNETDQSLINYPIIERPMKMVQNNSQKKHFLTKKSSSIEKTFYEGTNCTNGFYKFKDLSGISFFNIKRNSKEFESINNYKRKGYQKRKSIDKYDFEGDHKDDCLNKNKTKGSMMFPKIQQETSTSFIKTIYNK